MQIEYLEIPMCFKSRDILMLFPVIVHLHKMASVFGRFARLPFSHAVRASRTGVQRRFRNGQADESHLEIDANARGNLLLMIGAVLLPVSIYMVSESLCVLRCLALCLWFEAEI